MKYLMSVDSFKDMFLLVRFSFAWAACVALTAEKRKFSIKDFFSNYNQIRSFLQVWLHLLKKSLMENFIFYAPSKRAIRVASLLYIFQQRLKKISYLRCLVKGI